MGKTTVNTALNGISGRVDQWVYRQVKDQTVVARRPVPSERDPSPRQLARRERFDQARLYAKTVLADPNRRRVYEALAAQCNRRADRILMADYLTPPAIELIDVSAYRGQPGDVIQILATDDIEVVAVKVTIRRASGEVVEQGITTKEHGLWRYPATAPVAAGENVTVLATARDRPGNETTAESSVQTGP